ncbi:hypothetical protein ACGLFO_15470, partial [Corynebacterium hesseae]|uniref:hypothetical protein n=1 Tax=Corynebacterium hesseae TaxID=2913502 RepID=UPI00373FB682
AQHFSTNLGELEIGSFIRFTWGALPCPAVPWEKAAERVVSLPWFQRFAHQNLQTGQKKCT